MNNYGDNHLTKAQKKLYILLNCLEYSFEKYEKSKKERIKFQKIVYSLQKNGFKLGFNYNLYLNGPYSPNLAAEGYFIAQNLDEFKKDNSPFKLSKIAYEKIDKTKNYLDNDVLNTDWLETIATIDFLVTEVYGYGCEKQAVFKKFMEIKPHLYDLNVLEKAWKKVDESNE